jgi:hypothetical protein
MFPHHSKGVKPGLARAAVSAPWWGDWTTGSGCSSARRPLTSRKLENLKMDLALYFA